MALIKSQTSLCMKNIEKFQILLGNSQGVSSSSLLQIYYKFTSFAPTHILKYVFISTYLWCVCALNSLKPSMWALQIVDDSKSWFTVWVWIPLTENILHYCMMDA